MKQRTLVTDLIPTATALLLGLCLAGPMLAGPAPAPGQSCAFGKSLAEWQDIYFRWWIGETVIAPDANGNAVVGNVALLPLPNVPGDGTPGHLDIKLKPGQGFALPLFFFLGTSYLDSTPPDTFVDPSFFDSLNLKLTIDGVVVVNQRNWRRYFSEAYFAPAIPINDFGIDSVIWYEDVAVVHGPLCVGKHTVKVDLKATQPQPPNFGGGYPEYHNSWTITVRR
jgi:hypothetical protein